MHILTTRFATQYLQLKRLGVRIKNFQLKVERDEAPGCRSWGEEGGVTLQSAVPNRFSVENIQNIWFVAYFILSDNHVMFYD